MSDIHTESTEIDPNAPSLPVMVVTRDLDRPDLAPREKEIDFVIHSDREWLYGHQSWAVNHRRSVTIYPR
jgi:hypothetical protein